MSDPERSSAFTPEFIAAKKAELHPLRRYTTVKFEDEAEWAHFLEWVSDTYGGPKGLRFSIAAVPMTIRVSPDLLESSHLVFPSMREATEQDEQQHLATLKGKRPFDPEDLRGRHIPGLGYFRPRTP